MLKLFASILFCLSLFKGYAQKYGDQDFYLIDSLRIQQLSQSDKELIDTSLLLYHNTLNDTVELGILEHIVDNCWNDNVWPRYNQYLKKRVQLFLVNVDNEQELKKLTYFLAGAISNEGFYFDQHGDLIRALDKYHESLNLYQRIDNKQGIATTFNNLGVIYSIIGDTSKALDYHHQSLSIKIDMRDSLGTALSYNNIGSIYETSDLPFKALDYFENALEISQWINDPRGEAMAFDNIGDIYFDEAVYGKALEYYRKGLQKWELCEYDLGISTGKNNLANVLIQIGEWEEAEKLALESKRIAEQLDYPIDLMHSSKTLMTIYEQKKSYEKAYLNAKQYSNLKEEIQNERHVNEAFKKGMTYEYQKNALEDSLKYENERQLSQAVLKQKRTESYALYIVLGLLIVLFLVGLKNFNRKKRDNELIQQQKTEVEAQNLKIEEQHLILKNTHQEISDSINYAQRIQSAILPSDEQIQSNFADSFVLFMPKDVVSGDFYWSFQKGKEVIVAVADCTGHGVPGAMVSIVCNNALNRSVREFNLFEPAQILDKTRDIVIEAFESSTKFVKDGMDISLLKVNLETLEVEWSGANNPLYILGKNEHEIQIIPADKQPVGMFEKAKEFTNHLIKLNKGDRVFLFTDGFMDQFGGDKGKKYKYSRFREFIANIQHVEMELQKQSLENEFVNWKGELEQVDDICIIGLKF